MHFKKQTYIKQLYDIVIKVLQFMGAQEGHECLKKLKNGFI